MWRNLGWRRLHARLSQNGGSLRSAGLWPSTEHAVGAVKIIRAARQQGRAGSLELALLQFFTRGRWRQLPPLPVSGCQISLTATIMRPLPMPWLPSRYARLIRADS